MTKLSGLVRDALNEVLQHGEAQLARLVDHREAFDEGLMDVCAPVVLTSVNDPELGPSPALGVMGLVNCVLHLAGCACRVEAVWEGSRLLRFELCTATCGERTPPIGVEGDHFGVMSEVVAEEM